MCATALYTALQASLKGIDAFIVRTRAQILALDESTLGAVREQALTGAQARRDIVEAKESIAVRTCCRELSQCSTCRDHLLAPPQDLFDKIKDIKGKAEQSEVMVQEICADIKQLDVAKRHLTTTITSLKRLQMLITAVDRLQDAASRRQYQDAAQLLEAVNQLFTHFDEYDEVPKVRFMALAVGVVANKVGVYSCGCPCSQIAELLNTVTRVKKDLSMLGCCEVCCVCMCCVCVCVCVCSLF